MQKDASMSRRSFAALGAAALASACAGALAPRGAAWADPSGTASVEAENGCVRITHPDLPTSSNIPQATRDDPPRASVTIGSTEEPSWLSVSGVPAHRDCAFLRVTVSDGAGGFAEVARYDEDEGKPSLLAWNFDLGATALHFRQTEIGGDAFNLKMRLVEPVAFPLAFRYEYAPAPVNTISFHADRGSGSEVVAVYERHYLDERGEPPAVSRPGCLLAGWRNMGGPASGPPAWYEPTLWMERADLDFEAVWEAREYTVSYDLAGGTLDGAATAAGRVVGFSDKGILPVSDEDPTREGFAFAGWAWQGRPVAPDDSIESLAGDDSSKYAFEVDTAVVGLDEYSEAPVVVLVGDFTNESDETVSFSDALGATASQGGRELSSAYLRGADAFNYESIAPGETVPVFVGWELGDAESDVEIVVYDQYHYAKQAVFEGAYTIDELLANTEALSSELEGIIDEERELAA